MKIFTIQLEFVLSDEDENKIFGLTTNGHDLDSALEVWRQSELLEHLENEYFIAEKLLEDIKNYLEKKYNFAKTP